MAPVVGPNSVSFAIICSYCMRAFAPAAVKINLPSTILQFWDLGGQTGLRIYGIDITANVTP